MSKNINKLVFNFFPPPTTKSSQVKPTPANGLSSDSDQPWQRGRRLHCYCDWTESGLRLMDSTETNIIRWAAQSKNAKMKW